MSTRYEEKQRARERANEIWETARILNRKAGWALIRFFAMFWGLVVLFWIIAAILVGGK